MDTDDQRLFKPCSHTGPCTKNNAECFCIAHGQICTKQCVWGKYGVNKFKGCQCTDGCQRSQFAENSRGAMVAYSLCDCIVNNRECDPELCRCSCSTDQRNMQIAKRRDQRRNLFIAPSTILNAGWGLFSKRKIHGLELVAEVGTRRRMAGT